MPDWTYTTSSGTDWNSDTAFYVSTTSISQAQQESEEYVWEREYRKMMLQLEKEREEERGEEIQLAKDKIKYPLFFLKEGIV